MERPKHDVSEYIDRAKQKLHSERRWGKYRYDWYGINLRQHDLSIRDSGNKDDVTDTQIAHLVEELDDLFVILRLGKKIMIKDHYDPFKEELWQIIGIAAIDISRQLGTL